VAIGIGKVEPTGSVAREFVSTHSVTCMMTVILIEIAHIICTLVIDT